VLSRKLVKFAIPLAVGALTLTACGGSKSESGGKPTYSIGFEGPLSGDNSGLGINEDNGLKLAVDEANAKGDLPFKLTVDDADDQGQPDQAPAAAQQLAGNSKVVAAVGPSFSGPAQAGGKIYTQAGLAEVTPSATNPTLTSQGFTTFLRGVPNDNVQGLGMAKFLNDKIHAKKVYIVDDKSTYGAGLAQVAAQQLKAAGVAVVRASVPAKTPDYTSPATAVVNSHADALIYAGYYADLGPFAKKLVAQGYKGVGISGDGSNDPHFVALAGKAAEGWYLTCPCTDASAQASTKKFAADYTKKFKVAPGVYSAESFDIANMIIQQMKSLGKNVTRAKLLSGLKSANYTGLTKTFSFTAKGELKTTNVYLYQVKNGKIGFLGDVNSLTSG
jgi:branched-chain amino acid transport system substrate-binding protein